MIKVTHQNINQDVEEYTETKTFESEPMANEGEVIDYIADWYIWLTPDQRRTIKVIENDLDRTNYYIYKAEQDLRKMGWAVLDPIGVKRPEPTCPACGSLQFIKIGRYPDGKCKVHCLDCSHEAALTNEEYYVDLF